MNLRTLLAFLALTFLISCSTDYSGNGGFTRALKIHHQLLTLDSHTDTPLRFSFRGTDMGLRNDPRGGGGKLDFPRMGEGGLDGVFFAVFLGQEERTAQGYENARQRTSDLFDSIYAVVTRNHQSVEIALNAADLARLRDKDRRAVYIGIENGYPVGKDLSLDLSGSPS